MESIRVDAKAMTDLIRPDHRDIISLFAASYQTTKHVDINMDDDGDPAATAVAKYGCELSLDWPDRANKDKEAANKLHRTKKFEEAVEMYTNLIDGIQEFISITR